jgi:type III secretory pathway component EscV
VPPTAVLGLWLFAGTAAAGVVLAVVDLARGGSSTFLWRAIKRPSMRRYGPPAAYVVMLVVTLPVALFPMFPQWWLYVWLAALLALPVWVVRARRAR